MKLIKYILGFLLKFPNSSPDKLPIAQRDFYILKQKILKKFGTRIGYDKQKIETICVVCNGLGEVGYITCPNCTSGIWKVTWIKLAVVKLGNEEFHYPRNKFSKFRPTFKYRALIDGHIEHVKSKNWHVNCSLYVLLAFFNGKLLKKMISFHLRGFYYYNKFQSLLSRVKCRFTKDSELPF